MSKSGTLTYEAVAQTMSIGEGQSTCVGIGGDGEWNRVHRLAAFEADPQTAAIVTIGEIGGNAEQEAAAYAAEHVSKPIVGSWPVQPRPPGKRMGHAGAIISGGKARLRRNLRLSGPQASRVPTTPSETWSVLPRRSNKPVFTTEVRRLQSRAHVALFANMAGGSL